MTSGTKTPMDIMQAFSPDVAQAFLEHKTAIMENSVLSALPTKTKLLIGIGVAAALQSSTCTLMWAKLARKSGATDDELAEVLAVSRLMKAATVNDTAAEAMAWLLENPQAGTA